ncbi:MAG TPA: FAD-binding and (Fe-S)-binding domain-containing protein [Burkholderiales bacterium]|nr:FAD-binding and (Fe-S)-binding domain-containing protein [Burkholderiales bacterium]
MKELQAALAAAVAGEVRFDAGARAAYASEASNYRQVPIGVILPRSAEDVMAALAVCRAHGAPVLARGGGTSMCGQSVNVAVVIDCSKYMDRVLSIDAATKSARVEPGVVCDSLSAAAAGHGLVFGPDPATHSRCTLGGMIGNNSCGAHSVMAGKTVENIEALEVATYDGARFWCGPTDEAAFDRILSKNDRQAEIYRGLKLLADRYAERIRAGFPTIKRRVSGYNLDQLLPENGFNVARALVGSEGTCALTLQARATLVENPRHRLLLVQGYTDVFAAGDAVPQILAAGPIACEGLDEPIIGGLRERKLKLEDIGLLPEGRAWLMIEFGGDTLEQAIDKASSLRGTLVTDPAQIARLWAIRETGASATALNLKGTPGPDPVVGWEDAAVDPLRLGDYLREFQALVDRHGYRTSLYGHFGDGCIHARITFDLRTPAGLARWRGFLQAAAELVVKYGGSLSGEHGDGQARAEFLPAMYGPELMQAFREFKRLWDPLNRMNPGKLVNAAGDVLRVDENLRLGPAYKPVTLQTRFAFRSDVGDGFARAAEHCVGMGKCRSKSGGTMCPSYRGTGEERYSTRGRARLLWEMLQGEVITGGWQSEEVKEALDWCLACKGCRSDCPTHTDMAAYKAEFLSHYYEKKIRPPAVQALARIGEWAPLASKAPGLANVLGALGRPVAGLSTTRRMPRLAAQSLRARFVPQGAGERVILFDDTFNGYFRPATGLAAARVLAHAGCSVELPKAHLCCGRPYYDAGMLDQAKAALGRVLEALEPDVPVVVLEPACLSVFRDELKQLFADDDRAQALAARVHSLAEFLDARGYAPPRSFGRALLQPHCHQKALWGSAAEVRLLRAAGLEVEAPDLGCCGMAGSFGLKAAHEAASRRIAEIALLPRLRAAPPDTLVVADGFSCREQIEGLSDRTAQHFAEVLAGALR